MSDRSTTRNRFTLAVLLSASALLLTGCEFIGGADTIVKGNGINIIEDDLTDGLAAYLAEHSVTPEVTDEDLVAVYEVIRRKALEGDLQASVVLLKIAGIQRAPEEDED